MANVLVKVIDGVINDKPVGSEIELPEQDAQWLSDLGRVEIVKSAPKKAPARKASPKKDEE